MTGSYKLKEIFRKDGTFRDNNLESSFLDGVWHNHAFRIRIASLLTGTAYLAGMFSDRILLEGTLALRYMLVARIVTLLAAGICFFSTFFKIGKTHVQKIIFIYFLIITASECFELTIKPKLGEQYLPFLIFIVIGYCFFFPARPYLLVLAGAIATISYSSVLIFVTGFSVREASPTIITFCIVWIFSFFLVRGIFRANRSEFHANKELKDVNVQLQQEIKERKKVEEKLMKLASVDELTGVYNRRHFAELTEREIQRTRRTHRPLSLLFMDIDHFKSVNDTYGHETGDLVLKIIADVCSSSIRGLDILGRFGGEEFAFLLPEVGLEHAEMLGDRLRKLIAGTGINTGEGEINVTASFGVSVYTDENDDLDKMIKRADLALYKAKDGGRNQVVIWSEFE